MRAIFCYIYIYIYMTASKGTFSALLAFCAGISPVTGEFPSQRPVTRSFDELFDLHMKKRLSNQSRRRWFETPSHSLWRHCYEFRYFMGLICDVAVSGHTLTRFIGKSKQTTQWLQISQFACLASRIRMFYVFIELQRSKEYHVAYTLGFPIYCSK